MYEIYKEHLVRIFEIKRDRMYKIRRKNVGNIQEEIGYVRCKSKYVCIGLGKGKYRDS
jgi:hypothetical protein